MTRRFLVATLSALGGALLLASHTYLVGGLGDGGWISGDTRGTGAVTFVSGPGGPTMGPGSLRLQTFNNLDKATLENRGSFGGLQPFAATYEWYRVLAPAAVSPALKLGIDTPDPNPTSATAIARGENRFDKILVYEPYLNPLGRILPSNTWTMDVIDQSQGKWWIVDLDGAVFPGYGIGGPYKTLSQWLVDPAYGASLTAGVIASIQIGVGSGNGVSDTNVDYLTYTLADGTHTADFGPIPDTDGDGYADDVDVCPASNLAPTVSVGSCHTGVPNTLFTDGCTIPDRIAGVAAGAANHGQFVRGVAHLVNELKKDGILSGKQGGGITSCAARADLP